MNLDELLTHERAFWDAGGDPDHYRRHMADEGRCVFGFATLDKDATLLGIDGSTPWVEVTFDDVTSFALGPDAAALTYRADATDRDGQRYRAGVTTVYVRRDGRWQLLLHQQSPDPADEDDGGASDDEARG